jgi:protein-S-isoprenylcysteine O-methyltransferase Ste14
MEPFISASAVLPTVPRLILVVVLGCSFAYFLGAGARTFTSSGTDDAGALWAQISFMFTGALTTIWLGLVVPVRLYNGLAAIAILVCSLALYEWARHVIWGRSFYIAWSGDVPESLCERGPYAYIRHPIYASYILAFLAEFAAIPTPITLAVLLFNAGLFTHAALSDERSLASGSFGAEYAQYKQRTGMFLPRVIRR